MSYEWLQLQRGRFCWYNVSDPLKKITEKILTHGRNLIAVRYVRMKAGSVDQNCNKIIVT